MPFNETDLYLASGTASLVNSYVDPVYKFDSSSFYNWEQDNLPIYDLEDRDDLLFEQAGYPTSSCPGMMLTVSDCGIDNKTVFGSLDDAVSALPNTIRFPIIVEVALSGSLGGLTLENLQFEGSSAGLEIINRGMAKCMGGSATPSSVVTGVTTSSVTTVTSVDLSTTMQTLGSTGILAGTTQKVIPIWQNENGDATTDTSVDWWNNYHRAFILTPEYSRNDSTTSKQTVTLSTKFSDSGGSLLQGTANTFGGLGLYADNSTGTDIVVTNSVTTNAVQRDNAVANAETRATGYVYANTLGSVVVNNCVGPIFIRGFCVDGASQAVITSNGVQEADIGFDINNSDVVIENCTAMRCKKAGLQATNSKVNLNRGFIAFHNYELRTASSHLDTKVTTHEAPGLRAVNSDITVSASVNQMLGIPIDSPFCFYRNQVGMHLVNSSLKTPVSYGYGRNTDGETITWNDGAETIFLQSFLNQKQGIVAENSTIDFGGRVCAFQNDVGVDLRGSTLKVSEISVDHNQAQGLASNNSNITYNKEGLAFSHTSTPVYPQTKFEYNGQHVSLKGSTFLPKYVDDMPAIYTRLGFYRNFGIEQRGAVMDTVPAVVVEGGSMMHGVAAKNESYDVTAADGNIAVNSFREGFNYRVVDQSTLKLSGHKNDATFVLGPHSFLYNQKVAGVYAGNQSKVYISGPTDMGQLGIDCLAENNSKIVLEPHMKDGVLDSSGFTLNDSDNQTKAVLHATRACLVANKNSEIVMRNIGGYDNNWTQKFKFDRANATFDSDLASSATAAVSYDGPLNEADLYCSGSICFLPNPYGALGSGGNELNIEDQSHPALVRSSMVGSQRTFVTAPSDNTNTKLASFGGFCVRAHKGSNVDVQNVNFDTRYTNTSGPYYELAGTPVECDLLRIWNIADNSTFHASYLSVNSDHPLDSSATYYGPSALWTSSTGTVANGGCGLSGAPSSTPDSSGLSVLDAFGFGCNVDGFGQYGSPLDAPENCGPFRIYVSTDPKASFLGFPESNSNNERYVPAAPGAQAAGNSMGFDFPAEATFKSGAVDQIFAQGYSVSGDCSALNSAVADMPVSAIYQDLAFSGYYTEVVPNVVPLRDENDASSFFYPDQMIPETSNRIWLDESAMNTFANAKNGTLTTSRRKKIFSFYSAHTTYPGEATWNSDYGTGFGSANIFDTDRTY